MTDLIEKGTEILGEDAQKIQDVTRSVTPTGTVRVSWRDSATAYLELTDILDVGVAGDFVILRSGDGTVIFERSEKIDRLQFDPPQE